MKINVHYLLPAFAAASLLFAACGTRSEGDLLTETRPVTNFNALDISVSGDVEVLVDSVFHVEVTAEESALPYLETLVDNDGTLKIFFSRDMWDVDGLRIRVSAPAWKSFELSGSADVNVPDAIDGNQLNLGVSGSGNIHLSDIDFLTVKSRVSGSGNVRMSGVADHLICNISGSGNIDALACPVKTAEATVSGSGNASLKVTESLDATISGSGDIEYQGNPQVTSHISGSGRLRKI